MSSQNEDPKLSDNIWQMLHNNSAQVNSHISAIAIRCFPFLPRSALKFRPASLRKPHNVGAALYRAVGTFKTEDTRGRRRTRAKFASTTLKFVADFLRF